MNYILGIGSNLGDRKKNIFLAIRELSEVSGLTVVERAFIYENPAHLFKEEEGWNVPYLNTAVFIEYNNEPINLLKVLKKIEIKMGRKNFKIWSPRTIDLDILTWSEGEYVSKELEIPHKHLSERNFTLAPLRDLCSLGGEKSKRILEQNRKVLNPLPVWMGICNLSLDSFSDGGDLLGKECVRKRLEDLSEHNISIADFGAESTRPDAKVISREKEWAILKPALEIYNRLKVENLNVPKLSIDTRNFETAKQAMEYGCSYINDVSGLKDERFIDLIKGFNCKYVLMHSLSVPAKRKFHLDTKLDPIEEICNWLDSKIEFLIKKRVNLSQIIFDPGVGFGKTSEQSLKIIKSIDKFRKYPLKVMVGHSRKSFINSFSNSTPSERDLESVGVSLHLANAGVDILRVHNPEAHIKAHKAWLHVH